jgi:hypothetical protein
MRHCSLDKVAAFFPSLYQVLFDLFQVDSPVGARFF